MITRVCRTDYACNCVKCMCKYKLRPSRTTTQTTSEDDQKLLLLLNVARTGGTVAIANNDYSQHWHAV
eukprot:7680-Heterococcus_DN1.PRE.3